MIFLFHSLPTFADHHLTKSRFKPTLILNVLKVASLFQVNPDSVLLINAIDISDPDVENRCLDPENLEDLILLVLIVSKLLVSLGLNTRRDVCDAENLQSMLLALLEEGLQWSFFELSEAAQAKFELVLRYAFNCLRKSEAGRDIVYPVNSIAFHPIYGTFATSGCDGFVNIWDGNNRKRLYQYSKYPTSISALSFSRKVSTWLLLQVTPLKMEKNRMQSSDVGRSSILGERNYNQAIDDVQY